MINTLLAYDDQDSELGAFFESCGKEVIDFIDNLKEEDWNTVDLNSKSLNSLNVELQTGNFKNNFVFASFSFCFACSAGVDLGPDLIAKGTLGFIGYSDEVWVVPIYPAFSSCAVAGLFSFYDGATIKQAFEFGKNKYLIEVDILYKIDFVAAANLSEIRDSLVFLGDGDLSIKEFDN